MESLIPSSLALSVWSFSRFSVESFKRSWYLFSFSLISFKTSCDMSVTRFDLEKLEVGQSAEINLAGKLYTGKVSKLSRLAAENSKGTPVVSAEIHIDNPDDSVGAADKDLSAHSGIELIADLSLSSLADGHNHNNRRNTDI